MRIPGKDGGGAPGWVLAGWIAIVVPGCSAPTPGTESVPGASGESSSESPAPEIVAESDIFVRPLRVELRAGIELEVRYTLDGSDPERSSPLFRRPFEVTQTAEVRARSFHHGQPVSAVASRRLERVAPRPGEWPASFTPEARGLDFISYTGDWEVLPDFGAVNEEYARQMNEQGRSDCIRSWGRAPTITLRVDQRVEHLGVQFVGALDVPADDVYVFALASDDGSDLWLDGERVIDNDGLHGTVEKRGRAALRAGKHRIRVRWFNKTGGADLELRWAALGEELRPLDRLSHLAGM